MQKCETPAGTGASRKSRGGWFRDSHTPFNVLLQVILNAARVRPELAAMLAVVAGGHGHG
jgi:hypothetical protein